MSSVIRQDLVPVATGYVLVMGALAAGLWLIRRRGEGAGPADRDLAPPAPRRAPGWSRLVRHYLGTAIGGYLVLMAVVILYYYGVARVRGAFIESAFTGCALLVGLTTPLFLLASWLAERRRARVRRRGLRPGSRSRPR